MGLIGWDSGGVGDWDHGGGSLWGLGASETSSDWLTVIGARRRTISYPVSCELSHHARPPLPCDAPLYGVFFSLCLSLSESPLLPPCISLIHCGGLGATLTLASQSCIYLLYPRVCSMTMWCYWTVTTLASPPHLLFEPSLGRVSLWTQNQQGYLNIIYKINIQCESIKKWR